MALPSATVYDGLTFSVITTMESQPVAVCSVEVFVPAAVNVLSFQVYGSRLEHIVLDTAMALPSATVYDGLTFSVITTMESQPRAVCSVAVFVPAALNVLSFQVYGSRLEHIVWDTAMALPSATVYDGLTFNVITTMESQPVAVCSVVVFVPAALNVLSFQVYGSRLEHIVLDTAMALPSVTVYDGLTLSVITTMESQFVAVFSVAVFVPAA